MEQIAKASGTDVAGYVTEGPGLSAYALSDGVVYRTYSTLARGVELVMGYYGCWTAPPWGERERRLRVLDPSPRRVRVAHSIASVSSPTSLDFYDAELRAHHE